MPRDRKVKLFRGLLAYGVFREGELGTLQAGMLADIVVLDRNLFAIPAEMIRETKVVLTVMDGQVVCQA